MSSALRELLVAFGVEVDDSELKELDKGLGGLVEKIDGIGKKLAAAFAIKEVGEFIGGQIELGAQIYDTAEKLGVGTDELQEFQYAAGLAGVGADEAAHALGFLNKNIGEAIEGGKEQAQVFAKLGIRVKDSGGEVREVGDVLPELADKFAEMGSQQERTAMAMKLFGRSGAQLIPILSGGSEELKKHAERAHQLGIILSKDTIEKEKKAADEIMTFKLAMRGFGSQLVVSILPTLTEWTAKLSEGAAYLGKLAKNTNILTVLMGALAAVAAVLVGEFLLANAEFLLIAAAIGLIILVVEDLYTLFTGGDSIIGEFLDSMFGVGASKKFVDDVKDSVQKLYDGFMALWPTISAVGGLIVDVFKAAGPYIWDFWRNAIEAQGKWAQFAIEVIKKTADALGELFQMQGNGLAKLGEFIHSDKLKDLGQGLATAGGKISALAEKSDQPTVAAADLGEYRVERNRGGGEAKAGDTQNNIDISVQGGQTNEETGRVVANAVLGALGQPKVNATRAAIANEAPEDD